MSLTKLSYAMIQGAPVNVLDYGAVGDGTTDDTAAFNAAYAASPDGVFVPPASYKITGTVTGKFFSTGIVTIVTGTVNYIKQLNSATPSQNRSKVLYYSTSQVQVYMPPQLVMAGFRFAGSYTKGNAFLFDTGVNRSTVLSLTSNLGAETTKQSNNWYAVFACANAGDSVVTFRLMPFLRASSVAGSVITLNYAGGGAGAYTPTAATYTFSTNNLAGVDCLVINETVGGLNRFSGRVTTITANTTTSVTLSSIGAVNAYDFILPAPPGYEEYCYLGAFYCDSAGQPFNIADSGSSVSFYGLDLSSCPNYAASGTMSNAKVAFGGYISPLAMGITLRVFENISSASVGDFGLSFYHDSSSHTVAQLYTYKQSTAGNYALQLQYDLNFSQMQALWLTTTGLLDASRNGCKIQVFGHLEP